MGKSRFEFAGKAFLAEANRELDTAKEGLNVAAKKTDGREIIFAAQHVLYRFGSAIGCMKQLNIDVQEYHDQFESLFNQTCKNPNAALETLRQMINKASETLSVFALKKEVLTENTIVYN
ncbi:MAG: hypothetical protein JXR42_06435 [Gammaproteobacteria bacterium]|nr:hypothetical protein [Gammaproteobacteria bacterium]